MSCTNPAKNLSWGVGLQIQFLQFPKLQTGNKRGQLFLFALQTVPVQVFQRTIGPEISNQHEILIAQLNVIRNLGLALYFNDVHSYSIKN